MKYKITAGIMAVIAVILELLEKFNVLTIFSGINEVIVPVLFIGAFVCLVLDFKDDTTFKSKWAWVAVFILATYFLGDFVGVVGNCVSKGKVLSIISSLVSAAGFGVVLIAFLKKSFWKIAPFGFGGILVARLLTNIAYGFKINFMEIAILLMFAVLLVLSLKRFEKIEKVLRWVAIVLAVLVIKTVSFQAVFAIITAILLVPVGKFKINLEKAVAILCIVLTVCSITTVLQGGRIETIKMAGTEIASLKANIKTCEEHIKGYQEKIDNGEPGYNITTYQYSYSYFTGFYTYPVTKYYSYQDHINDQQRMINTYNEKIDQLTRNITDGIIHLIPTPVSAAGLICLAIVFWRKKYGKLGLVSCGLIGLGTIIALFGNGASQAIWNFDLLNYPIFSILFSVEFFSILLLAVLAAIILKAEERPVKLRVAAIILAVITAVFAASRVAYSAIYNLYAIAMILAAIALVPFKFNEYNSIGKHLFWNIITLGIWNLIWVYNVTKNLNKVNGVEERKAKKELLLYMFLPFYSVYWYYKTAEYIDIYAAENGKKSKLDILSLIFGLICPLVPYVVLQDKINQIVGMPAKGVVEE